MHRRHELCYGEKRGNIGRRHGAGARRVLHSYSEVTSLQDSDNNSVGSAVTGGRKALGGLVHTGDIELAENGLTGC